jgi:hypothetical protein
MRDDGSAKQRMLDFPIAQLQSVSPNGKWVAVLAVLDGRVSTAILGLGTDTFRWVRGGYWSTSWSLDGKNLYLEVPGASSTDAGGTMVIALTEGSPPQIPPMPTAAGSGILPHGTAGLAPGPRPDIYAFTRTEWLRNIYRIPLHR